MLSGQGVRGEVADNNTKLLHSSRGIVFLKIFPFLFLFCKIMPDAKVFGMKKYPKSLKKQ